MAATGARVRVPVAVACRVLKLSTQGYYKWLQDPVSQRDWDDAHAIDALRDIHEDDPTLGYRFLTDELADVGITASENRVWRLCSTAGVFASHARRKSKAGKPRPPVHDDLLAVVDDKGRVRHDFTATAPNVKWLTDITEHPTREGKVYLCAVKDCYSNKIVGYSIDSRMKSSLAASALRNAIALRSPVATTVHSDRGSQFRSRKVQRIVKNNGLHGSMGESAPRATTPQWSRSSRCCRRTSWTPGDGTPANNCAWRSSGGSRPGTTAGAVSAPSASSHRSGLR
jgi:putative transposase